MESDEASGPVHEGPATMRMIEDRWATFRHIIEGVAILLTLIWGFYTFVYAEKIKPALEPAHGSNELTIDPGKPGGRVRLVTIHMRYKNTSRVPIDVYAWSLNVYGIRYGAPPRKPVIHDDPGTYSFDLAVQATRRQLIASKAILLDGARGGVPRVHLKLLAGESFDALFPVAIPPHAFDSIAADDTVLMGALVQSGSLEVKVERRPDGSRSVSSPKTPYNSDDVEQQL